jgi:nucleotide-binding universal stress UspA family protein
MKILLAADCSSYTQDAARYLVDHLYWFARVPEVHIVHIQPPMPYARAASVAGHAAVHSYQREESEAALAVAEDEMRKAAIPYLSSWHVADIATGLRDYARTRGIDVVVMGSHGQGALANLALGSVVTKCIATLGVPVWVVGPKPMATSDTAATMLPSAATP